MYIFAFWDLFLSCFLETFVKRHITVHVKLFREEVAFKCHFELLIIKMYPWYYLADC